MGITTAGKRIAAQPQQPPPQHPPPAGALTGALLGAAADETPVTATADHTREVSV